MPTAVARAGALALLALGGCLTAVPADGGAEPLLGPATAFEASGPVREPHVAVRATAAGEVVVLASYVYDAGDGPVQDYDTPELVLRRSVDGGATWTDRAVDRATVLADVEGRERLRLGDPVLAYAPSGALLLSATAFELPAFKWVPAAQLPLTTVLPLRTAVLVARSLDDGDTWERASFVDDGGAPGTFPDKQWVATTAGGDVHLVWMRFEPTASILLHARSSDEGATWSDAVVLASGEPGRALHLPGVAAAGERVLVTATDHPDGSSGCNAGGGVEPGGRVLAWASEDRGASFGAPVEVGPGNLCRWGGHVAVDARDPLRAAVVGVEDREEHRVWLATTADAGARWSPAEVLVERGGAAQSHPAVWIDAAGAAHVAFYDAGAPDGGRLTRLVVDAEGMRAPAPVGSPLVANAFLRGEYLGLAGAGRASWAVWIADGAAGRLEAARLDAGAR